MLAAAACLVLFVAPLGAQPLGPDAARDVLREVAARFDPGFVGERALFAAADEPCLLPLLARLRAVAPQLDAAQRAWAASLDPALATVLRAAQPGALDGASSLPDYPELTETITGSDCVVHYTLTGQHAAPDLPFVKALAKVVDKAVKVLGKDFARPFFERADDDLDVLHVYVLDTSTVPGFDTAVLGFVNPTEEVPGDGNEKALTTYMVIDRMLKSYAESVGVPWKRQLVGTVVHEYFHCVQLSRNAYLTSWGLEGQAVWAEQRWGKKDDDLYGFLGRPDSLCNQPELPIWDDSIRKYSTAPLWAYLEQRVGKDALQRFWEFGAESNDPINVLGLVIAAEGLIPFEDFWRDFAGRLVAKDIIGLSKKKLPDVKRQEEVLDFGWTTAGSVVKTAILAYQLVPPSDKQTSLLFARVDDGDGAGDGRPEGVIVHQGDKRLSLGSGSWDTIDGFAKKNEMTLVVTDGHYDFPDDTAHAFSAGVFAPYLKVHDVDWGGPVAPGGTATVTFTYDLLCVPQGATFGVAIYRRLKGKGVDQESQANATWSVGSGQTAEVQFVVPAFPVLSALAVQLNVKTPDDAYGGEHVVSKHKGKIKIAN